MGYSVSHYLKMLKLAGRSEQTINLYHRHLRYFADYLRVPVEDLHNHLATENLINYAESLAHLSQSGRALRLSILHRYFTVNDVRFHELEANVLKQRGTGQPDDKPLTHEILLKMMDIADIRGKAIITALVSTGMRTGELCGITIADVDGDTIYIRPEITHQLGRTVYLNTEAREYLDLWLRDRPRFKETSGRRNFTKKRRNWRHDERLFCSAPVTLRQLWIRLYDAVDGERGKYRAKCTPHSCRKYFRTQAVRTMPLDLVEKIMGHEGYLTRAYVRIPDDEARRLFHEGEHVLYITRKDQRVQDDELNRLRAEVSEISKIKEKVAALEELAEYNKRNESKSA